MEGNALDGVSCWHFCQRLGQDCLACCLGQRGAADGKELVPSKKPENRQVDAQALECLYKTGNLIAQRPFVYRDLAAIKVVVKLWGLESSKSRSTEFRLFQDFVGVP